MINQIKRIHFVGIGGIGMSGLAEIMHLQGYTVSGSDRNSSDLTRRLTSLGVTVHEGHEASHADCDLLVYTSAVHEDNPELAAAQARGIPCVKRAELLGELTRSKRTIAVAGTHGKTTTSAMIAHVLIRAQYNPSIFIGGMMHNLDTHALYTESPWAVAEADEFDRSFLQLWPYLTVVNNIEADHLDCYADASDIEETFARFSNQTSVFGSVFLCADDSGCARIRPAIRRLVTTFGLTPEADVRAEHITQTTDTLSFEAWHQSTRIGSMRLRMSGLHNVRNSLACLAVAGSVDVPFAVISEGLESFKGTGRRFEILGTAQGITFVDDYAHHPTEIRATLEGARKGWPDKRIVAVFQPHLFSRTRDFFDAFAHAFGDAGEVWLTEIYAAREMPIPGITGESLFVETKRHHPHVHFEARPDELISALRHGIRDGDLVITLGAGDITGIGRLLYQTMAGGS
jgi:UDP-N-acetylmuramate--alanine ligase